MSLTLNAESVLKESRASCRPSLVEMLNRYNDLVKRGVIQKEQPKTFGGVVYPTDCKNKHINYYLSE